MAAIRVEKSCKLNEKKSCLATYLIYKLTKLQKHICINKVRKKRKRERKKIIKTINNIVIVYIAKALN